MNESNAPLRQLHLSYLNGSWIVEGLEQEPLYVDRRQPLQLLLDRFRQLCVAKGSQLSEEEAEEIPMTNQELFSLVNYHLSLSNALSHKVDRMEQTLERLQAQLTRVNELWERLQREEES